MLRGPRAPGVLVRGPHCVPGAEDKGEGQPGLRAGQSWGPAWVPWAMPVSLLQQQDLPAQTLQWDLGGGGARRAQQGSDGGWAPTEDPVGPPDWSP